MVFQKDALFDRTWETATWCLHRKFTALFHVAPDCAYAVPLECQLQLNRIAPSPSVVQSETDSTQTEFSDEFSGFSATMRMLRRADQSSEIDSLLITPASTVFGGETSAHWVDEQPVCLQQHGPLDRSDLPSANSDLLNCAFENSSEMSRLGFCDDSMLRGSLDRSVSLSPDRSRSRSLTVHGDPVEVIPLPDLTFTVAVNPQAAQVAVVLPEQVEDEDCETVNEDLSLADLAWGQNVPTIVDRDARLNDHVVNLSGHPITTDQSRLLALGLRFRVTPKQLLRLKLMAGVESAFLDLKRSDPDQAERFRAEAARILHRAHTPCSNLTQNLL